MTTPESYTTNSAAISACTSVQRVEEKYLEYSKIQIQKLTHNSNVGPKFCGKGCGGGSRLEGKSQKLSISAHVMTLLPPSKTKKEKIG